MTKGTDLSGSMKSAGMISGALIGVSLVAFAACVPWWGTPSEQDSNTCAGGNGCAGTVTKSMLYPDVTFPDNYDAGNISLFGSGVVGFSSSCNNAGTISGPYKQQECWPDFQPIQATDGQFLQIAYNDTTVNYWSCCADSCICLLYTSRCV